jgi:hypothetical protein
MAATTGLAVANIYYNQPMLGLIERDLPGSLTALVPTVTQLGYALGLFLLVPLGDLVERRGLILVQFLALAAALVTAAIAPNAASLLMASLAVGQPRLSRNRSSRSPRTWRPTKARRGHRYGHGGPALRHSAQPDAGGLCCRPCRMAGGVLAPACRWRALGSCLRILLPTSRADHHHSYGSLLASLVHLWRDLPACAARR